MYVKCLNCGETLRICDPGTPPRCVITLTDEQFETIRTMGHVDETLMTRHGNIRVLIQREE